MEIKHVLLGYSEHFLVVDGTRGEICYKNDQPATHPSGVVRYRSNAYEVDPSLVGKTFNLLYVEAEELDRGICEPAEKAFREYVELDTECKRIQARKYEPAPGVKSLAPEEVE